LLFSAPVSYTHIVVNIPPETPTATPVVNAYAEEFAPSMQPAQQAWAAEVFGPDNPPWGVGAAILVWLASVGLLFVVPTLAGIAYIITRINRIPADKLREAISVDPHFLLISVAAVIPAHLLTFWLVWWLVTGNGRRSFRAITGWRFSPQFGPLEILACTGVAVFLLVMSGLIAHFFHGGETDLDKIISSSTAARYTVVVLAVFSAPLVEEAVYRGVLYPALQRALGKLWAILLVAGLFALVHAPQYWANVGVIAAITLLSLTLTLVRAQTGRLLPCIIVHLIFNGFSSLSILLDHSTQHAPQMPAPTGLLFVALGRIMGLHF
jgi:uncharacterized protein